jgi:hypothetical protein
MRECQKQEAWRVFNYLLELNQFEALPVRIKYREMSQIVGNVGEYLGVGKVRDTSAKTNPTLQSLSKNIVSSWFWIAIRLFDSTFTQSSTTLKKTLVVASSVIFPLTTPEICNRNQVSNQDNNTTETFIDDNQRDFLIQLDEGWQSHGRSSPPFSSAHQLVDSL